MTTVSDEKGEEETGSGEKDKRTRGEEDQKGEKRQTNSVLVQSNRAT